jgi:lipopolysaccharide/colanic/teichoic acid biosynthesis glycosyltransferase
MDEALDSELDERPPSPALSPPRRRALALKRLFDICAASCGLALCLPAFAMIAAAIKCDSSGPVFFRQTRVGRHGAPFRIMKFRTMRADAEGAGPNFTANGDARITRVGAWLRASKFDELPQLFNVLVGDMSLVGPRPETPDLMAHYTPEQRAILLSVRPGVTDYASIVLRDEGALLEGASDPARFYRETLMPMKFKLCRIYLDEIGLRADLKIILMTLGALTARHAKPPSLADAKPPPRPGDRLGLLIK